MQLTLLLVLVALVPATLSRQLGTLESLDKIEKELFKELNEMVDARDAENIDLETKSTDDKCGLNTESPVPSTHTACITGTSSSFLDTMEPTDAQQTEIVNRHNVLRGGVEPLAADMLTLSWDEEIATMAQKWANQCPDDHDKNENRHIPGRYSVGQNMAEAGNQVLSWTAVTNGWYDEVDDFTYGVGSHNGKKVGHYTQVVAAKTTRIGCGAARCKTYPNAPDDDQYTVYYVCNYALAGNLLFIHADGSHTNERTRPYTETQNSCSMCPNNCVNNLCVCNDTATTTDVCLNGGKLIPGTCTCDCKYSNFSGKQCTECTDVDSYYGRSCSFFKTYDSGSYCAYSNFKKNCCVSCN